MAFKDHEKFLAFLALLGAVVYITTLPSGDGQNSTVRDVLVGLIGILGMASQGLFRISETAQQMNEVLKSTIDKLGNSVPAKGITDVPKDAKEAAGRVAGAAVEEAEDLGADLPKPNFKTYSDSTDKE